MIIKVCLKDGGLLWNNELEILFYKWKNEGHIIHIQHLNNAPYKKWLKGLNVMSWTRIIDIFVEGDLQESEEYANSIALQIGKMESINDGVDIYVVDQLTYKEPVDHSEVITSCYYWNYSNEESFRNEKMQEHFLLEQGQKYYDYVAFQCVKKCVTPNSLPYDFFFESHVSNPNGINEIYSKPSLGDMRLHSQHFLNVKSRLLAFGWVEIISAGI